MCESTVLFYQIVSGIISRDKFTSVDGAIVAVDVVLGVLAILYTVISESSWPKIRSETSNENQEVQTNTEEQQQQDEEGHEEKQTQQNENTTNLENHPAEAQSRTISIESGESSSQSSFEAEIKRGKRVISVTEYKAEPIKKQSPSTDSPVITRRRTRQTQGQETITRRKARRASAQQAAFRRKESSFQEQFDGSSGTSNEFVEFVSDSNLAATRSREPAAGSSEITKQSTEPVAGPSGMAKRSKQRVDGPSVLAKPSTEPVAGPSGIAKLSIEHVTGPSGLTKPQKETLAGPSGITKKSRQLSPEPNGVTKRSRQTSPGHSYIVKQSSQTLPGNSTIAKQSGELVPGPRLTLKGSSEPVPEPSDVTKQSRESVPAPISKLSTEPFAGLGGISNQLQETEAALQENIAVSPENALLMIDSTTLECDSVARPSAVKKLQEGVAGISTTIQKQSQTPIFGPNSIEPNDSCNGFREQSEKPNVIYSETTGQLPKSVISTNREEKYVGASSSILEQSFIPASGQSDFALTEVAATELNGVAKQPEEPAAGPSDITTHSEEVVVGSNTTVEPTNEELHASYQTTGSEETLHVVVQDLGSEEGELLEVVTGAHRGGGGARTSNPEGPELEEHSAHVGLLLMETAVRFTPGLQEFDEEVEEM